MAERVLIEACSWKFDWKEKVWQEKVHNIRDDCSHKKIVKRS